MKDKKISKEDKQKVRESAKKHFVRQKKKEFAFVIIVGFLILILPLLIGGLAEGTFLCDSMRSFSYNELVGYCGHLNLPQIWILGFTLSIGISLIVLAIFVIFWGIYIGISNFINENWQKAYMTAEKETEIKSDQFYTKLKEFYEKDDN